MSLRGSVWLCRVMYAHVCSERPCTAVKATYCSDASCSKVNSAIHGINRYPMDDAIGFHNIIRWIVSYQAPVVQKGDSAIRWIKQYPMDKAIGFPTTVIRWIVIYPVGSTIQLLNDWGQVDSTIRQNRGVDFTLSFYSWDGV